MKYFANRRAAKWHAALPITTAQWTLRPVTASHEYPVTATLFPYAGTQALTKNFLGRSKSQEEIDVRLLELIRDHGCKEIAFAACAAYLSLDAVRTFLETDFLESKDQAAVIEPWLQCFVAAAHLKPLDFAPGDGRFAAILVLVAADSSSSKSATLHLLFSAWRAGSPQDEGLLERAVSLTATVLHNARLHLGRSQQKLAWMEADKYRAPLHHLREIFLTAGHMFEGCVGAFFPGWRCWVDWTVDARTVDEGRHRRLTKDGRFACLWELDGPDLVDGDDFAPTAWQGYIRRQWLIPWLEAKGFKIGVGLIIGDTEALLTDLMEQFRRVVDLAFDDIGGRSLQLLKLFIDREGLDSSTLTAWEDARTLLVLQHPSFVESIFVSKAWTRDTEQMDGIIRKGLRALQGPSCEAVRRPLLSEIAQCVQMACDQLEEDLDAIPLWNTPYDWLTQALRLWELRELLMASRWLHSSVSDKLLHDSKHQPPVHDVQVLESLHVRVKTISNPALLPDLNDYIRSFLRSEKTSTKLLPAAIHTLWSKAHDNAPREAALTLATLNFISIDTRRSCVLALGDATSSAADQLQETLLQVLAKVPGAHMDLTAAFVSVAGLLQTNICWATLLWGLLKMGGVLVDQRAFTDRGCEAYIQWIRHMHNLFGGPGAGERSYLAGLDDLSSWLLELESLKHVLQALEEMEGWQPAMNKILATSDAQNRRWLLKILKGVKSESRQDRRNFMLTLLLSIDNSNAGLICTTGRAACTLDRAEFDWAHHFLELALINKDLAAARLAIRLNDSARISSPADAVVMQIKEIVGLREGESAWLAAKRDCDTRVKELLGRARKLESTRMLLMRSKRRETERMMENLKFEVPAGIAALVADLTPELADVVQDVAEDQLELHFSLNGLHSLTKLALGVQGTETVIVTLRIYGGGVVDAFCVHQEDTASAGVPAMKVVKWIKLESGKETPIQFKCNGKPSRLSHVVARTVWKELAGGSFDIAEVYAKVRWTIQNGANECIVCSEDIGARLHRATSCGSSLCTLKANEVEFALRVEMVRHDTRVMDLLLTAVYAVATAKTLDLLPGRPTTLNDASKLLALMNALPSTEALARTADMHMYLRLAYRNADLLVSWLCNASRTYIISATGHWRIPNMPGIHQFLVVDNPPEIEAAFAKHNHLQPRMVLFHGTTMDRLHPILSEGLRVLSNTPLMKHGAVSGPGIYFSGETSLPMGYSAGAAKAVGSPAFFKSRKDFDGPRILLGCEHAGPANKAGVHVVTDPTKVIVRYIFLIPKNVAVPLAKDIIAPMVGTFYSLRSCAAAGK